jgi:hypothetical protein
MAEIKVAGEDAKALVHHGGEQLEWQVWIPNKLLASQTRR